MHILCTNGTRTVDTLDHLPTLPLFIVYLDTNATISGKDELGMYRALRLRDRVHHIFLHLPSSILHKSLTLMEEPFSMLEYLSLWSATKEDTNLVLPKTFLAPNLRHLTLLGINLPKRLRLLTSAVSLVTLVLTNIRASGYFLPRLLVARLQSLPQLEELSIGFSIPIPRPSLERDLLSKRGALVMLPNLKHLAFQGIGAYMECLVAQIRAPLLERLDITLFNQIVFALPHLSHFTNITEGLKLPIAEISFGRDAVSVVMDHRNTRQHNLNGRFALRVTCTQFDWQIDCAAQICSVLMPALFDVEELKLKFYEQMMPTEWQDGDVDHTTWHELLRTFVGLKELHLCPALSQELSRVFQAGGVGSDPGLLPGLQEIVCEVKKGDVHDLFSSFVRTRRIAGRPVSLVSAYSIKAKALFAYTAPPDVPDGISFAKGEVLDIIDMRGKWWQAQKEDNTRGVAPPSYLQIIRRSAGSSNGSGPHQAKALYAYTGSLDDPNVISFSEGEILNVIDMSGWWWQARKEGGTLGIAPSSYLKIIGQQPARYKAKALYPYTASPDHPNDISFSEGEILDIIEMDGDWWEVRKEDSTLGTAPSNFLRITEHKATALYAYTASPDHPNDISFSEGEILNIIEMDGDWWEVRKEDGTLGTAPSNFLRIIERQQIAGFKAKALYI
ncbi:hypothetical protein EDB92DRAFT_109361 [Lactarius akahatsu]|uniref:SH3 domain-containing protein n=1 Tax=Lactarius akahatsu TaxID=416441 RepID=A0AAD4LKN3_9AGAM|nr:hypothetical protein EDB92DRAFT_109361 [Lactarius akahatsu]